MSHWSTVKYCNKIFCQRGHIKSSSSCGNIFWKTRTISGICAISTVGMITHPYMFIQRYFCSLRSNKISLLNRTKIIDISLVIKNGKKAYKVIECMDDWIESSTNLLFIQNIDVKTFTYETECKLPSMYGIHILSHQSNQQCKLTSWEPQNESIYNHFKWTIIWN